MSVAILTCGLPCVQVRQRKLQVNSQIKKLSGMSLRRMRRKRLI